VKCDEGDVLSPGQIVLRLHVPDLDSRIAQKQSEVQECRACLRQLVAGARSEELAEQRQRVRRAQDWRDLSANDLQHARQVFAAELLRLDHSIAKSRAALDAARHRFQRTEKLAPIGAVTKDEYEQIQLELRVAESEGDQLLAAKSAHQAKGTRDSEAELARREKELADERGKLALMEAGTRQEEIEAEQARDARLQEELSYLLGMQSRLLVTSSQAGVVTTPRMNEKIGQYVREGELLCIVEELDVMEAEIALDEQRLERVKAGQPVFVKLRTAPLATYAARVERVGSAAVKSDARDPQAHVTVYCRLDQCAADLRPGMTGYARVSTGRRPLGKILADHAIRMLRTEFWL
jgi:multidrug resistance efflux pump